MDENQTEVTLRIDPSVIDVVEGIASIILVGEGSNPAREVKDSSGIRGTTNHILLYDIVKGIPPILPAV